MIYLLRFNLFKLYLNKEMGISSCNLSINQLKKSLNIKDSGNKKLAGKKSVYILIYKSKGNVYFPNTKLI